MNEWLASRAPRERMLLFVAAALTAVVGSALCALALRDDLRALRARVAAHERELVQVRRLAARLRNDAGAVGTAAGAAPLVARMEAAATAIVGRDRIASMTPASAAAEDEERVALRLAGASLADTVRLLHALGDAAPPLQVTRLELRKRSDDRTRFEATIEVAQTRAGS